MVNVFLVDDHSVFRAGVRAELGNAEGISIVGDAGTVAEATSGITDYLLQQQLHQCVGLDP